MKQRGVCFVLCGRECQQNMSFEYMCKLFSLIYSYLTLPCPNLYCYGISLRDFHKKESVMQI